MTMRKPVARVFMMAAAFSMLGVGGSALGQVVNVDDDAPKAPKRPQAPRGGARPAARPVTPKTAPTTASTGTAVAPGGTPAGTGKVVDNTPTPVAGQPSDAAAQAKKLYESEKWWDAAQALYRVYSGETGDDLGNQQIAQFNFAKTLYKLKFYQGAYKIFIDISERPNHLKFKETLLWLAKLATDLPEPADIIERVGHYSDEAIAQFNNKEQSELYWQLNYLLGRFKYRQGGDLYQEALAAFQKVDRRSKYYIPAQFFSGITYVQLRQSKPAVQAFQRILGAIEDGDVEGVEDETRMRDLAYLSMARTFYSASVKLDDATGSPTVDGTRLSAAVKYWNKVESGSEYWLDALFEESWAYFMAGDYAHALGNIHTIQSPYFPNSDYPEADVLKAYIYFVNCQYDDAAIIVAQFHQRYDPIKEELTKILERFKQTGDTDNGEEFFKFLKDVKEGKANLGPKVKPIVENALSDRQLLRNLEYVRVLDDESRKLKRAPGAFRDSKAGDFEKDALADARKFAVNQTGDLARARYKRNLSELNEDFRNAQKILIDITSGQRSAIEQAAAGAREREALNEVNVVKPDDEHVIWPFKGEYWRDELGFYRQTIVSKCGR
jgi:tetratricopeptide (TPR) repeat protein